MGLPEIMYLPTVVAWKLVRRIGYPGYLVCKVLKAVSLPVYLILWGLYAFFAGAFLLIVSILAACIKTGEAIAADFNSHVLEKCWFTHFSYAYYRYLWGERTPLPPEDIEP